MTWQHDYAVLRANPARWARHKAVVRRRNKERYATDAAYREMHLRASRSAQHDAIRDPKRWVVRMLTKVRHRCKKNGLPFDLEPADVTVPSACPVFGTPFVFGGSAGKKDWNSPSVDRIDPSLGYVKGNVCVISTRANTIKNNATEDEILAIAAYIRKVKGAP